MIELFCNREDNNICKLIVNDFFPATLDDFFLVKYSHSTRLLAATTLRNVLGTKNLAEILSERETISQVMQNALDEATDPWGVKVSCNVIMLA